MFRLMQHYFGLLILPFFSLQPTLRQIKIIMTNRTPALSAAALHCSWPLLCHWTYSAQFFIYFFFSANNALREAYCLLKFQKYIKSSANYVFSHEYNQRCCILFFFNGMRQFLLMCDYKELHVRGDRKKKTRLRIGGSQSRSCCFAWLPGL